MRRENRGPGSLWESVVRATIASKMATAPHEHRARVKANTEWIEQLERDLAPFVGPLVERLAESLPEDHPLQPILRQISEP